MDDCHFFFNYKLEDENEERKRHVNYLNILNTCQSSDDEDNVQSVDDDHCDGKVFSQKNEKKTSVFKLNSKLSFHNCKKCTRRFKRKEELVRHIKLAHKKKSDRLKLVQNIAESPINSPKNLNDRTSLFCCQYCKLPFDSDDELKSHLDLKHRIHTCHLCTAKFLSVKGKKTHFTRMHQKMKYSCDHCDYEGRYKGAYYKHMIQVHKKSTPFQCNECLKSFCQFNNLKSHIMLVHRDVRLFPCNQCDYVAKAKTTLQQHFAAVHLKLKPHMCTVCSYRCYEKKRLQQHVHNVHLCIKEFVCPICGTQFGLNKSLTNHIDCIHYKLRPFACSECDYKSGSKRTLKLHILSKHRENKPFTCDLCDYQSTRRQYLKTHVYNRHSLLVSVNKPERVSKYTSLCVE